MSQLPAILGGQPVREKYLPYGQQWIDEDDIEAVVAVLRGAHLTTGPNVKAFEEAFAAYVGAKYAVAVSNGTTALHCACYAAGIGPGDEVITSPMTFVASANCVLYQGGIPVFADIDPVTYNISAASIEAKISDKTKAIILVDFTGQPCDYDAIRAVADRYNLILIADAAHALGATYKNQKVGTLADMTEFSFHPVKHITTGEGGIIVTDNEELYNKLMIFRTHGITRDPGQMVSYEGPWYYEQQALGNNYRITDLQCALGKSQLTKIDGFLERRREIATLYNEKLKDLEGIRLPVQLNETESAWHLYIIHVDPVRVDRKTFFEALVAENIGVNVHYIPVYFHPYYQSLGYQRGLCPNAEYFYSGLITLPLFPKMTDADVDDVVEAVKKLANYYIK